MSEKVGIYTVRSFRHEGQSYYHCQDAQSRDVTVLTDSNNMPLLRYLITGEVQEVDKDNRDNAFSIKEYTGKTIGRISLGPHDQWVFHWAESSEVIVSADSLYDLDSIDNFKVELSKRWLTIQQASNRDEHELYLDICKTRRAAQTIYRNINKMSNILTPVFIEALNVLLRFGHGQATEIELERCITNINNSSNNILERKIYSCINHLFKHSQDAVYLSMNINEKLLEREKRKEISYGMDMGR